MGIRQLNPGEAWNEAERRAIPFGIIGFFLLGVFGAFGHGLGIRDPFLAAVSGAIGFFLGVVGFLIGFYGKNVRVALPVAVLSAVLPFAVTAVALPLIGTRTLAIVPGAAVGMGLYVMLHCLHRKLAHAPLTKYAHQLAYDQHGEPKGRWDRPLLWVLAGLGAATLLVLLTKS